MRGTHVGYCDMPAIQGIIPAYAGNTVFERGCSGFVGDHPRICGEHGDDVVCRFWDTGSSPHMRGTLVLSCVAVVVSGIIPAYAGNTRAKNGTAAIDRGSSPHMRGTHTFVDDQARLHGIIPAYAGNTGSHAHDVKPSRDHPRICGEHPSGDATIQFTPGSSPHMRGTPRNRPDHCQSSGIIPAYAGNTWWVSPPDIENRDHPRICGEHVAPIVP